MPVTRILLSADFLAALAAYTLLILAPLPALERIHARLEHPFLQWQWDHVAIPLYQAAAMVTFILIAYPALYGLADAPAIGELLFRDELRFNHLLNLVFAVSLLFPLLPVIGGWHGLIVPLQGVAASTMVFSWLAAGAGAPAYSLWPGWVYAGACLLLAFAAHRLALWLIRRLEQSFDRAFHVSGSGEVFSRALILLVQSPVILIYSIGLGRQLA